MYGDVELTILVSMIVLIPYGVFESLDLAVIVGKACGITDFDLEKIWYFGKRMPRYDPSYEDIPDEYDECAHFWECRTLCGAAQNGHPRCICRILRKGNINVNVVESSSHIGNKRKTPLMLAAYGRNPSHEICFELIFNQMSGHVS